MLAPIEEIFCEIDDFCNEILKEEEGKLLANPERQRKRESSLSKGELTFIINVFLNHCGLIFQHLYRIIVL
jgi:hypothetical protein